MTSKEALKELENIIRIYVCDFKKEYTPCDYYKWLYKERFEAIQKDLEVLELLKALFKGDIKAGNKVCTGKFYYDKCFVMFTSKEAYNKIKEWLEQ